jgi:hypothetical protein
VRMKYQKYTEKYLEIIFEVTKKIIIPILNEDKKELGKSLMNSIVSGVASTSGDRKTSPKEYFIANKLFRPLIEIINTVDAIENIAIYMRSFPYKRQGISQAIYLKYHVENYLNELYLLKNRLVSYLKLIDKSYKKSKCSEQVAKIIFPLYTLVSEILEGYIKVRGVHVHQYRYSDDDFNRLSTLELLSRGEGDFGKIMQNIYDVAYKETRKIWVEKIRTDIIGIHNLLERYFKGLLTALSNNRELIFPDNIKMT